MRGAFLLAAMMAFGGCGGGDDSVAADDDLVADGDLVADDSSDDAPADSLAAAKAFCVTETNRYRGMNSRDDVVRNSALEDYADTGAEIDYHASPHDHFSSTRGGGIAFGECECPHWSLTGQGGGDMTALVKACLKAFYDEGPGGGHHDIMVSASYGTLGCGIYQDGDTVTIIQDYGQ